MGTTMKLYRVTFIDGRTVEYKASNPRRCSQALSRNGGSDIRAMELLAVDANYNGKDARAVARLSGVQTRHLAAFPAKVLARFVLTPNHTVDLAGVSNRCVVFRAGGAR